MSGNGKKADVYTEVQTKEMPKIPEPEYELTWQQAADLQPLPWNPPGRTAEASIEILLESIRVRGILDPIWVTPSQLIVDGHRRWTCAKILGIPRLRAFVYEGTDIESLYAEMNSVRQGFQARDWLRVYVMGGAVSDGRLRIIHRLERRVGTETLREMAKREMSPWSYVVGMEIATYCNQAGSEDVVRKVVKWLMDTRQGSWSLRQAMTKGIAPDQLLYALEQGRKIVEQPVVI